MFAASQKLIFFSLKARRGCHFQRSNVMHVGSNGSVCGLLSGMSSGAKQKIYWSNQAGGFNEEWPQKERRKVVLGLKSR